MDGFEQRSVKTSFQSSTLATQRGINYVGAKVEAGRAVGEQMSLSRLDQNGSSGGEAKRILDTF